MDVPVLVRRPMLLGLVALVALGLAACGPEAPATAITEEAQVGVQNAANTAVAAATVLPTSTPLITPTALVPAAPLGPQQIWIDAPPGGWLVGSPMQLRGRTQRMPVGGQLRYQVFDQGQQVLGANNLTVSADGNGGGFFDAPLTFNLPQNGGNITAHLFEPGADGSQVAAADLGVFVQSQVQAITIDSPDPGQQVGSPMTIKGQVARLPDQGFLSYVVTNSSQVQIGANTFPITGQQGHPASYDGQVEFNLPFEGDTITVRIYDQDPANGVSRSLYVAPAPQSISITSPASGQMVTSPITVKGTTTRFPANGQLIYRVTQNGQLLGSQPFLVGGTSGAGAVFDTQVSFSRPTEGGIIQVTISDPSAPNGPVETMIDLDVRASYQRIDILSPSDGTPVGSPMTIKGNTNWFPNNGVLIYRVFDANNAVIGTDSIAASGRTGERGTFDGQVRFTEPPNGGVIRVELIDQYSGNAIVSSRTVNVLPPPPPQIVINDPLPGTPVGSPMTIVGFTTFVPSQLSYRVRDAAGNVLGQGSNVPFTPSGRQANFTASLTFNVPAAGGNITLDIFGPAPNGGQVSASTVLYVVPRP